MNEVFNVDFGVQIFKPNLFESAQFLAKLFLPRVYSLRICGKNRGQGYFFV